MIIYIKLEQAVSIHDKLIEMSGGMSGNNNIEVFIRMAILSATSGNTCKCPIYYITFYFISSRLNINAQDRNSNIIKF